MTTTPPKRFDGFLLPTYILNTPPKQSMSDAYLDTLKRHYNQNGTHHSGMWGC